ncbi:MAG: lytic transglycosylase [Rhodobacteraceae bacterium]|nr:lytic transglycosylase [Paracoccaceae bacterium]
MRKYAIFLVLILSSCVRESRPPERQDNACSILEQRNGWLGDMLKAEQIWGAPVAVQMAIIWKESSFRARAKTTRTYFIGSIPKGRISTAFGFSQALDGTWGDYQEDTGARRARRSDYGDSVDFVGWYMAKSNRVNGIAMTDAYNQYLAYHQGQAGYARGSYRSKEWLINVARQVQNRANLYETQLAYCS